MKKQLKEETKLKKMSMHKLEQVHQENQELLRQLELMKGDDNRNATYSPTRNSPKHYYYNYSNDPIDGEEGQENSNSMSNNTQNKNASKPSRPQSAPSKRQSFGNNNNNNDNTALLANYFEDTATTSTNNDPTLSPNDPLHPSSIQAVLDSSLLRAASPSHLASNKVALRKVWTDNS